MGTVISFYKYAKRRTISATFLQRMEEKERRWEEALAEERRRLEEKENV